MVLSSCSCRFSLPCFCNLAANLPCFVSSRRFSITLFRSPRNRCGIFIVGLSPAFCTTYEIGAYSGVVYVSKPAVVCPFWLFFCFLHYVRHRCLLRRRLCFLTAMAYVLSLPQLLALRTSYVLIEASCLFSYPCDICALVFPLFSALRTP